MSEWNGSQRFFRQENGRKHTRLWTIKVSGPLVITTWGVLDGTMQEAAEKHIGVNIGKSNYVSPDAYALDRASEQIRKKRREGYREYASDGSPIDKVAAAEFDFENLPVNLCFYKPDNSMGAGMLKKAAEGKTRYTRKRNGLAYIITRGTHKPILYSRRMLRQHDDEIGTKYTWNDRFPHIIAGADSLMMDNSILLGELVMDRDGADDTKYVQSITKSLTPQSIIDQGIGGQPSFYIWDIAYWDGENWLKEKTVGDRHNFIHELEYGGAYTKFFMPIESFGPEIFPTPDKALAHAIAKKWEGFVVIDPDGNYGDKGMNFKGKPDRPGKFCAKLKPSFEDDFLVYWDPERGYGERSTKGRSNQGIASVALYQYNRNCEQVFISNLSSGLTEDMKLNLADPTKFPQVWRVEYDSRTYISHGDETNALTFARLADEEPIRTDKKPTECINQEL